MDVQGAINAGYASGLIYDYQGNADAQIDQIRIAFDGDAVLFSDESERIYQTEGIEAFVRHEKENARKALPAGPFSKLLKTLSTLQQVAGPDSAPIRTALVTARNSPAHERVIRTLREWKVRIDEAFFLGGMAKHEVLRAFKPHIFFDDQPVYCEPASHVVPAARVLYKKE